ncbi:MAG: hypothetical protein IH991_19170, partial [Planctomycetes bacterium]|nr:hypothetical protein [Planctomycetota bacterium]
SNKAELQRELELIEPTNRLTDIGVALRAAAGLANPNRSSEAGTNDVQVADAVPATLYIVSDGGFADVQDFSLGNLSPKFISIGSKQRAQNVAIVAFSVDQNPEKPQRVQAFARIENYGKSQVELLVALYLNQDFQDNEAIRIPGRNDSGPGSASVSFYLTGDRIRDLDGGVLTIELKDKKRFDSASRQDDQALGTATFHDHLPLDNLAHAVINAPRQARVLLVTPDNAYLRMGLDTEQIRRIAHVDEKTPEFLKTKEYLAAATAGDYDLIIYDQCAPSKTPQAKALIDRAEDQQVDARKPDNMPQSNTLFIGTLPPHEAWKFGETKQLPGIIDIDHAHPMMHLMMDLRNAIIFEGFAVEGPMGSKSLVDADLGSLLTISSREGFEDAVLGFPIISTDANGNSQFNTNWPRLVSFPVFLKNVVTYLGGSRGLFATPNLTPGKSATLRSVTPAEEIRVRAPGKKDVKLGRTRQNTFLFGHTDKPGVYEIREGSSDKVMQRFAVNLFDSQESNIIPGEFAIGHQTIAAETVLHTSRQEIWKLLLLGGLAVLVFEWYIFNRRVYL